jgi:hypothetical protein
MKYLLAKVRSKPRSKFKEAELKAKLIGKVVDCDDFECMIELPNKQLILVPRSHVNEISESEYLQLLSRVVDTPNNDWSKTVLCCGTKGSK